MHRSATIRARSGILGACLLVGCPGAQKRAPSHAPHPGPAASEQQPASKAGLAKAPATKKRNAGLAIGWAEERSVPTREARRLNEAALARHRAGDYEAARAGFEAAREAGPSYAWPRFNEACAASRLGDLESAATLLEALLAEDLPEFGPRLATDEDLGPLHDSPRGHELDELVIRLSEEYAKVLDRGVPAFVYRERSAWSDGPDAGRRPLVPYRDVRIGVYDLETRRFVPMVPRVSRVYSGLLDVPSRRALVARGALTQGLMAQVQPRPASVLVFSLDRFGERLLAPRRVSPDDDFLGFEAQLGDGATVLAAQIDLVETIFFAVDQHGKREIGWTGEDSDHPPPEAWSNRAPFLSIVDMAEAIYRPRPDVRVRFGRLSQGGGAVTLKLSRGHHARAQVYASNDPMVLVVVSDTTRFADDGAASEAELDPWARDVHVVDRVDLREQTVVPLSRGRGIVHVAWAPDGTLVLERTDEARRYAPGSIEPQRDVPPWIHFGTPPFPEEGEP